VERLCDRVIIMKRGRIEDDDSPDKIMARYNRTTLEEVFLDVARGASGGHAMSQLVLPGGIAPHRINAMILRYWYLLLSSWPRLLELIYWPALQIITGLPANLHCAERRFLRARRRHADRRGAAVGHPVPRPARLLHVVSRGDVGAQSRQPDDEPVEAD
jgi:hypothetical protein